MIDSQAHRIEKICKDSDTVAINPVTGVFAMRSGAKNALPTGAVMSVEYNDYRRVIDAWIRYRDGSRLHYWKGKSGLIYAKAYIRKPHFSKRKGIILPIKFLGLRKNKEDKRIALIDNLNDWIRDIRQVGTEASTAYRLLAVWLHEHYPNARTPDYLKIRSKSECWMMAARAGVALIPVMHGRELLGYEYAAVKPWAEPSRERIQHYACVAPRCPGFHRNASDSCLADDIDPCS